ncbi:MAG: phosphoribosyltransferase, partial [Patescibacteria group bacterium]
GAAALFAHPPVWKRTLSVLQRFVENHLPRVEVLVGIERGGAHHGAALAMLLDIPFATLAETSSGYKLEGATVADRSVLPFDDVVTTAGSLIRATKFLRSQTAKVDRSLAIADHCLVEARIHLEKAKLFHEAPVAVPLVVSAALGLGLITDEDFDKIDTWRTDPRAYGGQRSLPLEARV